MPYTASIISYLLLIGFKNTALFSHFEDRKVDIVTPYVFFISRLYIVGKIINIHTYAYSVIRETITIIAVMVSIGK